MVGTVMGMAGKLWFLLSGCSGWQVQEQVQVPGSVEIWQRPSDRTTLLPELAPDQPERGICEQSQSYLPISTLADMRQDRIIGTSQLGLPGYIDLFICSPRQN